MIAMKVGGYADIDRALVRLRKLVAAERISPADGGIIEEHLLAAQAQIVRMVEFNGRGEEIGNAV